MEFPWSRFPSLNPSGPDAGRRRLIAVAVLAVAMLGVAGYWGLRRLVAARERSNQREAEAAFLAHDFQRTQLLLEQAVQVNPRNLDSRRALAEFYERANPPLALARWREAVVLEPESDEARLGLASCALRLGDLAVAREALAGVAASGRERVEYQRLAAGLALLSDDRAALEQALTRIAQLEPGDVRARFNLANLQHTSRDARTVATGRATLVALARGGPLAIRATVELMRPCFRAPLPAQTDAEWEKLAREIAPEAASSNVGRLALMRHALAQPAPTPGDAAVLIGWLGEIGLAREAFDWLDGFAAALRNATEVRTAHADLAARAHDWKRLQPLVQDGAWGNIPADVVTLAFAARAQHEGLGASHARVTWDDALDLARAQLSALHVLRRLAEAWAWPEATKAALWHIAHNFPAVTAAWRALAAGAEADGDSAEAWEVAQSWARAQPAEPAAQGRAQWLGVLLDKADAPLQAAARAAIAPPAAAGSVRAAAAPESLAAGALLLLRAGRAAESLAAMRPHEAAFAAAPRAALAYGNLLAVAGPPGAAVRWLAVADAVKLLPEERAMLEQARALVNASAANRAPSDTGPTPRP